MLVLLLIFIGAHLVSVRIIVEAPIKDTLY